MPPLHTGDRDGVKGVKGVRDRELLIHCNSNVELHTGDRDGVNGVKGVKGETIDTLRL